MTRLIPRVSASPISWWRTSPSCSTRIALSTCHSTTWRLVPAGKRKLAEKVSASSTVTEACRTSSWVHGEPIHLHALPTQQVFIRLAHRRPRT